MLCLSIKMKYFIFLCFLSTSNGFLLAGTNSSNGNNGFLTISEYYSDKTQTQHQLNQVRQDMVVFHDQQEKNLNFLATQLQEKLNEIDKKLTEKTSIPANMAELELKYEEMSKKYDEMKNSSETWQQKYAELENDHKQTTTQLLGELASVKTDNSKLKRDNANIMKELGQVKTDNNFLKNKTVDLQQKIDGLEQLKSVNQLQSLQQLDQKSKDLETRMNSLENTQQARGQDFMALYRKVTSLETKEQKLETNMQGKLSSLEQTVQSKLTVLQQNVQSNLTALQQNMQRNLTDLQQNMQSNLTDLQQNVHSNLTVFQQNMQSNLTILQQNMQSNLTDLQQNMQSNLTVLQQNMQSNLTDLQQNVHSNLTVFQQNMQSNLTVLQQNMQSNLTDLQQNVHSNLTVFQQNVKSNLTVLQQDLNTTINGLEQRTSTELDAVRITNNQSLSLLEQQKENQSKPVIFRATYLNGGKTHVPAGVFKFPQIETTAGIPNSTITKYKSTGKFTCHDPGYYYLILTTETTAVQPTIYFMVNSTSKFQQYMTGCTQDSFTPGATAIILNLQIYDEVWIKTGGSDWFKRCSLNIFKIK